MKFEGIIPPVVTPFRADTSVDEGAYADVIEVMIAAGVHGIIAGGTTGEFYALTPEERVGQFALAREVIKGRVPLLCGVNDITTAGACAFAEAAVAAGADGLLLAAPYYSLPTQEELARHCLAIDRAAGLPIMLYNYPGRTGVEMSREFLDRVGESGNFQCIKEASGDINRLHMLANSYPTIQLSCGAEDQALEFFVWGATSWVTPMGNFFAEEVVAFYDTCVKQADYLTARRIMAALLPLTTLLESGGQLIQCTKFACDYFGLRTGPVRPPLAALDETVAGSLGEILTKTQAAIRTILRDAQKGQGRAASGIRLVDQA